jgi:hypothetical protein
MSRQSNVFIGFLLGAMLLCLNAHAQERCFDLLAGGLYPIRVSKELFDETPRVGLSLGLMYRSKNEKGELWSANLEYQLLQSKGEATVNGLEQKFSERLEMLYLRASPLAWLLGKKKQGFVDIGAFGTYLLHEEVENKGNLVSNTKLLHRFSLGPSICLGVQLGQSLRKSLVIGLRNDYGVVSFGKKQDNSQLNALKFNTISLFAGLGI